MNFVITAPPFCCGPSWLVNVLMELGLKVSLAGTEGDWRRDGDGWFLVGQGRDVLEWSLPILHAKPRMPFAEGIEGVWGHRVDYRLPADAPTILYLRDPRDAIYSLYRRSFAPQGWSYSDLMAQPGNWSHHFPGLFLLPPPETFILFAISWLTIGEVQPVLPVAFEAMRATPEAILREVLDFIGGPPCGSEQVAAALAASTFDAARHAMEAASRATGVQRETARRGQAGEWRERRDEEEAARLDLAARHYEALMTGGIAAYDQAVLEPAAELDWFEFTASTELPPLAEIAAMARAAMVPVSPALPDFPARAATLAAYQAAKAAAGRGGPELLLRLFRRTYLFLLSCVEQDDVRAVFARPDFDDMFRLRARTGAETMFAAPPAPSRY